MFLKSISKPSTKPAILLIHNTPNSLVKFDCQLLQQRWRVREWYQQRRRVDLPALWRAVKESDLIYCWFAGWHSFLPVKFAQLMNKPSLVVTGGCDVANLPKIGYGAQFGGVQRFVACAVIENASRLIVPSTSSGNEAIANANADPRKIEVVPLGLPKSPMRSLIERQKLAITVSGVRRENLLCKGLLPFVQAAAHLPDTKFIVVGKWYDDSINDLRRIATPNVDFSGYLPDKNLADLYQQASVYVQASLHEGFGLSVSKAMLGGSIPVVTRAGSLPEIVGNDGIYLDSTDPQQIANAIQVAHDLDNNRRLQARERILSHFSLAQRQTRIHNLVNKYLPQQQSLDISIGPAQPNNLGSIIRVKPARSHPNYPKSG